MADAYLLENGTDRYLLEDGSGVLLLDVMVAFDVATANSVENDSTLTISHTCSGTDRVLIVDVAVGNSPDTMTCSVTYNGVAMVSLAKRHSNDNTAGYIEKFVLINPASGTHDVVATLTAAAGSLIVGGKSYNGASQTLADYTGGVVSAAGSSTTPTVDVTGTAADSIVDDGACNGNAFTATGAGQTQRWDVPVNNLTAAGNARGSTEPGNGGTVTMSYTVTSDWWAIVAVEIPVVADAGETVNLGEAAETDTGHAVAGSKVLTASQATETDTGHPLSRSKAAPLAQAGEVDTGHALMVAKTVPLGQAIEIDTGLALIIPVNVGLGQAVETDVGRPLSLAKIVTLGLALETDTGHALVIPTGGQFGQAVETNSGLAVSLAKIAILSQSAETDAAFPLVAAKTVLLGQAVETAVGLPINITGPPEPVIAGTSRLTLTPHATTRARHTPAATGTTHTNALTRALTIQPAATALLTIG